ncbi:MAG: hypothetical protein O3C34_00230 [Proteobacteria bacterium]|nr:hypothetical protein [Pseudomonadota bacterium]
MSEIPASWQEAHSLSEAIFIARESLDGLTARDHATMKPVVSFHDIYRYATDPAVTPSTDLARALATDARAREDLRCLLARVAPYRPVSRAAASSGTVTTRSGSGFEISLRESRADPDQLYLIIKLANTAIPAPGTLFVIGDGDGCRKVPLPKPIGGVIQLLLDTGSDLVGALCNPKTDVFLR